jgi:hypothetical protein
MMEERYHAIAQNRFYLDMSNLLVNKNITLEAKLISPPTYKCNAVSVKGPDRLQEG